LGLKGLEPNYYFILYATNNANLLKHVTWIIMERNEQGNLHFTRSKASSLVRVISSSRHDDGRREFWCFTNRWLHWTCSGPLLETGSAGFSGRSHWLSFVYTLR